MQLDKNIPSCVLPIIDNHKDIAERIRKSSKSVKKIPLTEVPKLHSRPGASIIVYLNFGGQPGRPDGEYQYFDFSSMAATPFDQDGDPTTFSEGEIESIRQIWAYVAEKYSIFDVDITTEKSEQKGQYQCVIGGDGSWMGYTAGGVSYVGRITSSSDETVTSYVFPPLLGNHPKYISDATAHEIGHSLGLNHQPQLDAAGNLVAQYDYGTAQVAPVMGCAYFSERAMWYKAPQDDIGTLGVGSYDYFDQKMYKATVLPDESSNQLVIAADGTASASGMITAPDDVDAYSFEAGAGHLSLKVSVPSLGGALNAQVVLKQGETIVAQVPQAFSFSKDLEIDVSQGRYVLEISSDGEYGSRGRYAIEGKIPAVSTVHPKLLSAGVNSDGDVVFRFDSIRLIDPKYKVSGFSLKVNGQLVNVASFNRSEVRALKAKLVTPIKKGQKVTVSYVPGNVADGNGNLLLALGEMTLKNYSTKI